MKLEHIAIWTHQMEELKAFYTEYFQAASNNKYTSDKGERGTFSSYFLSFDGGARLELMTLSAIPQSDNPAGSESTGLTHLAFSVDTPRALDRLYYRMKQDNVPFASEPRITGDGYYEFCVLDPDGNRVEITTLPLMSTVDKIIGSASPPFIPVDFNELVDHDLVLLSQTDARKDHSGDLVSLSEGLNIIAYEKDEDIHGIRDDIVAEGFCTENKTGGFPHVKWILKINSRGIRYVSDIIEENDKGEQQHA